MVLNNTHYSSHQSTILLRYYVKKKSLFCITMALCLQHSIHMVHTQKYGAKHGPKKQHSYISMALCPETVLAWYVHKK